jgi:NAD(P)-dependent dehydrogenase (short-subunit alcohol dehydrogenase family)|tara:strand:- start:2661 stop:3467 length:807 start_codon:yes stop_codon:yes gene_type:complete
MGLSTVCRMHISELFSVEGKVAVVTGGSRGIGYMISEGLVRNGVRVYITARKADACDNAAKELSRFGECISLPADLSDENSMAGFVRHIEERESRLDILVNNAGAAWGAPLGSFPASGFDKVFDVNVKAPFMLTQAFLDLLKSSAKPDDPARVIMIGSADGIRVPFGDNYSYSASKSGIHMLSRHLAHHLVREHINVNVIAPGPFESKMMSYMLDDPERRAGVVASTPRGRIGEPEDIVGATIFLSSRASSWLTGVTIPVDGGISTHG